jgi:uncharacterized protein (TIGR00159 family)
MTEFGIKDIFDIVLVASLLFYLYRIMKESGTINLFYGVLAFIMVWVVASEIIGLRMIGTILDKFMSIGLLVLVIIFQDQIKRFLVELGSQKRWRFIGNLIHHHKGQEEADARQWVMPVVYACMNMPLENYENTGDIINANINSRLIENIFFKNSPLHDGAMIITRERIMAAGCILPVSHDTNIPRSMGLRHRSGLGISQATDAVAVIVSEETGNISVAHRGKILTRLSSTDLEQYLSNLDTPI